MDQFREVRDDLVVVEIHALEDLLDIGGGELEGVVVRDVADDEVDVLVLANEVRETAREVALGLEVDVRTLVGSVDLRADADLGFQVEVAVAHLGMELQEGDAHADLALLAAGIELGVDGLGVQRTGLRFPWLSPHQESRTSERHQRPGTQVGSQQRNRVVYRDTIPK